MLVACLVMPVPHKFIIFYCIFFYSDTPGILLYCIFCKHNRIFQYFLWYSHFLFVQFQGEWKRDVHNSFVRRPPMFCGAFKKKLTIYFATLCHLLKTILWLLLFNFGPANYRLRVQWQDLLILSVLVAQTSGRFCRTTGSEHLNSGGDGPLFSRWKSREI